jgi:hypothetical protein
LSIALVILPGSLGRIAAKGCGSILQVSDHIGNGLPQSQV